MATVTIKPSSSSAITLGGANTLKDDTGATLTASSAATRLNDGLDTTYAIGNASATLKLAGGMTVGTIPAGSVMKSLSITSRGKQTGSGLSASNGDQKVWVAAADGGGVGWNESASWQNTIYGTTIANYTTSVGTPLPWRPSSTLTLQQYLAKATIAWETGSGQLGGSTFTLTEFNGVVTYSAPPTASSAAVVTPGDLTLTSRPAFQWSYSNADGLPQYSFRTAVWALADVTAFPGGRTAFEADPKNIFSDASGLGGASGPSYAKTGGGYAYAKSWSSASQNGGAADRVVSSATTWTSEQDLTNAQYVFYAQTSSQVSGYLAEGDVGNTCVASLDFTLAITVPSAPTSVTATFVAGSNVMAPKVTVAWPSQTLGSFATRKVFVEHKLASSSTWTLMPNGAIDAGTAAGSADFYDTFAPPNSPMNYRARAVLYTSTVPAKSSAGSYTSAAGSLTPAPTRWTLRDPVDPAGACCYLEPQGDLQWDHPESVGEYQALGSSSSSFASDGIRGRRWQLRNKSYTQYDRDKLTALRALRRPLVLQGDMTGKCYWVRFGPDFSVTAPRASNRTNDSTRVEFQEFTLVECTPIANQPQSLPS